MLSKIYMKSFIIAMELFNPFISLNSSDKIVRQTIDKAWENRYLVSRERNLFEICVRIKNCLMKVPGWFVEKGVTKWHTAKD